METIFFSKNSAKRGEVLTVFGEKTGRKGRCSKRPLPLTGSLINQDFIVVCTFSRKGKQSVFRNKIHLTAKQIFQIHIHASKGKKAEAL